MKELRSRNEPNSLATPQAQSLRADCGDTMRSRGEGRARTPLRAAAETDRAGEGLAALPSLAGFLDCHKTSHSA